MLLQVSRSLVRRPHRRPWIAVELLESRQMLSVAVQGYTPAQIRHAYGFDAVFFANGTVAADGAGQTIAIVDAYNDPNITADLAVFDRQFGLAAADLTVVNQGGGKALPATDAGWAGEISLDVEWAHAIAPAAKILLVEANSSSLADLLSAVDYARHAAGVSAVSMSWGGSEFFSWSGGEYSGETAYDYLFSTPSGHQGVTFVASAGDSGALSGVQWPSASPKVISVGGTSLFISDSSGTYSRETGWGGTNGGFSQVEGEPSYQSVVQNSGARTVPDVSYDADPNTGFAVYDSLAFGGESGWQEVGGTSAGSPQWAALIAIANQGRVLGGAPTLYGASQTLPALYALYNTSDYDNSYHDVTTGGHTGYSATPGYDLVTGLGSPKAGSVISALMSTAGGPTGGLPGGATPAQPASPLSVMFRTAPTAPVIEGKRGNSIVRLTNVSGTKFSGPVTVTLYLSSDGQVSNDDTVLKTLTLNAVNLRANGFRPVMLHFTYADGLPDGSYQLIASVDAPALAGSTPMTASTVVSLEKPAVDLSTVFAGLQPIAVTPGRSGAATLLIQNLGNVAAVGTLSIAFYRSTDGTLDASDAILVQKARPTRLRPGGKIRLHLSFTAPADQLGGQYNLLADVFSSLTVTDMNTANDVAISATVQSASRR